MVLDVANAAPLPEAKPNDVGFSQQVLARLDDFFVREMAAKRVSGAVVAIARDDKLVHYKGRRATKFARKLTHDSPTRAPCPIAIGIGLDRMRFAADPASHMDAIERHPRWRGSEQIPTSCPCRKPNGWRLTENRTMLICNERSFQAHCLGGCRSVSVASSDRGRDLDVAAADNCSATNHPQETILRCHRPIGVRWSLSPLPSRS